MAQQLKGFIAFAQNPGSNHSWLQFQGTQCPSLASAGTMGLQALSDMAFMWEPRIWTQVQVFLPTVTSPQAPNKDFTTSPSFLNM